MLSELISLALWRIETELEFPEEERQWQRWLNHRFPLFNTPIPPEEEFVRSQLLQRRLNLVEYILLGHVPHWLTPPSNGVSILPVLVQMLDLSQEVRALERKPSLLAIAVVA